MMDSKFTRAEGIISSDYMDYDYTTNYFHAAGGLNLRGYTGYLLLNLMKMELLLHLIIMEQVEQLSILKLILQLIYLIQFVNTILLLIFADAGIIT